MKKLLSLLLILTLTVTLAASCGKPQEPDEPEKPDAPATPEIPDASEYADRDVTGRNVALVTMQIKNYGTVKLLLDATSAPRTVANFLTLAKSGFYDGLDFFAAQQLASLVGLDAAGVEASTVSAQLKALAKDAFRTVSAIYADGSASKYVYLRDTEGRETYTVEMKVEGYDTPVVILLDKTTAPITVENFLDLVGKGFYDGLDFHRIIKGFMIQGGDDSHLPADEQAASIKGEFASNGHDNDILHLRGTISMARTSVKDSASSGFFICDADSPHLDGDYAAFGCVVWGIETVDRIAEVKTNSNDKPLSEVVITEAYFVEAAETDAGEAEDENKQS